MKKLWFWNKNLAGERFFLYSEICAEDDKREGEEDKRQKEIAKQVLKNCL